MFFRVFGNYLKNKNLLDDKQLETLMKYRRENRVKLGMLAVEQGLMTAEQAEVLRYHILHLFEIFYNNSVGKT